MNNAKRSTVEFPFLQKPIVIYERECGHKVILAYKPGSLINISTWVKTGSINETDENTGISHLLEHVMFKGTKNHKAGEFDTILEAKGAIVNAATWKDYTCYYVTIPNDKDNTNFDLTLNLHADMMLNPIIPDNEIGEPFDLNSSKIKSKRERHVVIEEIRMREDQPWTKIYNETNANMYQNHPYKRDVIGTAQIISTITRDTVMDYYNKYYTPNTLTTIVVGDFNEEETFKKVATAFDFKGRKNCEIQEYVPDEPHSQTKYIEIYSKVNTGFLMFGYLCPKANDIKNSIILIMASIILGDGSSSRLYQRLIEKNKNSVFNLISSDYYNFKDGGNLFIQANFKPEKKEEAIELIKQEITNLLQNSITEKEFKKAKKQLLVDFAENTETVSDLADTIGYYLTVCNDLHLIDTYINELNKLTINDFNDTIKKYLNENKATIVVMLPESNKETEK